jgi:enoyl-[acyl-carrier protein] reductase I
VSSEHITGIEQRIIKEGKMGLLDGKVALVFGVANKYSLAWGIAEALAAEGAEVGFSYAMEKLERRVRPLAESVNSRFIERCNVTSDGEIADLFAKAADVYGTIDILVHAIAYAEMEDLNRRFLDTSRTGFHTAMDISVYSMVALAREVEPLMHNGGSIVTLSYYGAEKFVPHYNVMAVAKAALEASVRYLAAELGPAGIRVNAISAGPVKTLSAGAFIGFRDMLHYVAERAPLRRNITQGEVGQTALYLLSDLSSGVTGETLYVDAGYHILGMPEPVDD